MMMKQYNFKITPELEEKVKKALNDSGLSGKSEFLEEMVTVYASHLVNRDDTIDLDISAYKHINNKTKEVLEKTFNHLLSSMDYNFSSLLQEKVFIEQEKKRLDEKSLELDGQVDRVKVELLEEQKVLEAQYSEKVRLLLEEKELLEGKLDNEHSLLIKVNKELSSLSTIAEQTSSVIEENKELRAKVLLMEREHRDALLGLDERHKVEVSSLNEHIEESQALLRSEEKKLFEVSHSLERCQEDLRLLTERREGDLGSFALKEDDYLVKIDSLSKELALLSSTYNQLLGKVEVFEKFAHHE